MEEQISDMIGQTFVAVDASREDELIFTTEDGKRYVFNHVQDCCEIVEIKDICGDLSDLVGSPLLVAEERTTLDGPAPEYSDSYTWTFYTFATIKGSVTVSWLGESNGYYSESVDFHREPA